MKTVLFAGLTVLSVVAQIAPIEAEDPAGLTVEMKRGGYVIVFRHTATDERQKDIYPLRLDDMSAQRQLNEDGRASALAIGDAWHELSLPLGLVLSSPLNRAVETARMIARKNPLPMSELADSSGGNAPAMAGTAGGGNVQLGRALVELVNSRPEHRTNTVIVTHKTNIGDAFSQLGDIREGEAAIFKWIAGGAVLQARFQSGDWATLARKGNGNKR